MIFEMNAQDKSKETKESHRASADNATSKTSMQEMIFYLHVLTKSPFLPFFENFV